MELLQLILERIALLDLPPIVAGTIAGLYVQANETERISLKRLILVCITSLATGYFVGNAACTYWNLNYNVCAVTKFLCAVFALDILDTFNKLVEYAKSNPHELIARILPKIKNNVKNISNKKGN